MQVLPRGIYAGILYQVVQKDDRKRYIAIPGDMFNIFVQAGANMQILDDIGNDDPEERMAQFIESLPAKK